MILFLDDERNPKDVTWEDNPIYQHSTWEILRTANEFKNFISFNIDEIELISFDHDIQDFSQGHETTGYNLIQWLVNYCIENVKKLPNVYVHSKNPIGKNNILCYYNNALLNCPELKQLPNEGCPVLAKIKQLNSNGFSYWYEVVYHDGENWRSYSGSDTFKDAEVVVKWRYVELCLE